MPPELIARYKASDLPRVVTGHGVYFPTTPGWLEIQHHKLELPKGTLHQIKQKVVQKVRKLTERLLVPRLKKYGRREAVRKQTRCLEAHSLPPFTKTRSN